MTITEKIIARASGRDRVSPGDVVFADVDKVMVHDVSGPGVATIFHDLEKEGKKIDRLWDPSRVWVAEDHFVPCSDKQSAQNIGTLEDFVKRFHIAKHFKYGFGQYGICHTLSHEEALVLPGEVYVGGDSHTNTTGALGAFAVGMGHTDVAYVLLNGTIWFRVPETLLFKINGRLPDYTMAKDVILRIIGDIGTDGGAYKAMQFAGSAVKEMAMDERITLTNMTTEAGAKNGIIEPDEKTIGYLKERTSASFIPMQGDPNAEYAEIHEYEGEKIVPLVAKPYSPANVVEARELSNVELDKAYVGSCTGAKLTDLREVAKIMKGRKIKVRTEILPAAQSIYMQALKEGLIQTFMEAGALIGPPTCGACCGAHMGVLRKNEVCISTTNRNFPGRMGDKESKTYLASPQTTAASALTGRITDPRDLR
ncbi:MAG: 3-isopropylmalate dehydratase large subunit [Thaumarchaeota archaeon]|nr:3-isopropylmalate dehydratase large subunit [Nitrososphaerota archaeon]